MLIFYIAWRRSHRNQPGAPGVPRPKIPYGRAGVPTAALLVCLVGAFVEWGVVAGGTGHAWVALLWTAGAAASVWLAQRYRRTVVITALRAFVALAVIGAIAERTLAPVVVAAASAVLLMVLQKLWNPPVPPIEDFDELIHNTGSDNNDANCIGGGAFALKGPTLAWGTDIENAGPGAAAWQSSGNETRKSKPALTCPSLDGYPLPKGEG